MYNQAYIATTKHSWFELSFFSQIPSVRQHWSSTEMILFCQLSVLLDSPKSISTHEQHTQLTEAECTISHWKKKKDYISLISTIMHKNVNVVQATALFSRIFTTCRLEIFVPSALSLASEPACACTHTSFFPPSWKSESWQRIIEMAKAQTVWQWSLWLSQPLQGL